MKRIPPLIIVFAVCFLVGYLGSTLVTGKDRNTGIIANLLRDSRKKNILLIGVDARHPREPSRSDTIMVAFCNPQAKRVDLLSVPRDTRVLIAGDERHRKINHAMAEGGPQLLRTTVEELLDTKVDGWIAIDFQGFAQVIDTLGGITIDVEERMYYPSEGINLRPGIQRLNGKDALAYVRYRSDGLGDIGRIERQQKFMHALAKEMLSARGLLKSPTLFGEIQGQVDTNLSNDELLGLVKAYIDFDNVTLNTHTLPGEPHMIGGGSYWIADRQKTRILLNTIQQAK